MELLRSIAEVKARLRPAQREGLRVGLVPTMGALHDGHLSLVTEAAKRSEIVVASVFVNPTQFGPNEDFDRYPRDLEADRKKLRAAGCNVLFAPSVKEIYPDGFQTFVEVTDVTQGLCGAHRPTHFRGVTTIVLKLFEIVRPDVAVFGEKDFQQLTTLRRMAKDLALDVQVVGAPIVRESDGLAMSSRNAYLSDEERGRALSLNQALRRAKEIFDGGISKSSEILAGALEVLAKASVEPEYLELRSAEDLRPLDQVDQSAVILVAATVGKTRLIDNLRLGPAS